MFTGLSLCLTQPLAVPAVTNLIQQPQAIDNAAWSKTNITVTADAITAADGTTTADKIAATASGISYVSQATTTVAGTCTFSVEAKAGSCLVLQLCDDHDGNTTSFCNFDLSGGTIGSSTNVLSSSITSLGGGWYRCQIKQTALAGSRSSYCVLAPGSASARATSEPSGFFLYLDNAKLVQP